MNRHLLRRAGVVVLGMALVAAACGGDDDEQGAAPPGTEAAVTTANAGAGTTSASSAGSGSTASSAAPVTKAPSDVDEEGVLKIGRDLTTGSGVFFDLTVKVSVPSPWHPMIYDTLLRRTASGGSEPGMAKEVTIVDPSTLTVELNDGMTFTDGTPVDAEAIKYGIERNITKGQPGSFEAELYQLESITVDGPLALTIKLKTPIAGAWYRLLSLPETSPVSPTADRNGVNFEQTPVGAGPFMVESFELGQRITLVKNPDFFQADQIRLAGIEFLHVSPDALVNALRSDFVDISVASYTITRQLEGTDVSTNVVPSDNSMLIGHICKNRPPFDDVRVRQAINHAINRDALNQLLYGGKGEPMWGFFKADSEYHVDALDNYYAYDQDKARQLLADAGQSDLAFEVFFTPSPEGQAGAEALQAQLSQVGVTITLKPLTVQTDFFPDAKGAPMYFFALQRSSVNKITRVYVPGSYGNVCTWDDPELNAAVAELQKVREDSPAGVAAWKVVQERAYQTAVSTFALFGLQGGAWNDERVGNPEFLFIATEPVVNFYDAYIKA